MEKDFDRWNEIKKRLTDDASLPPAFPKCGEVWMCTLGKNFGRGGLATSPAITDPQADLNSDIQFFLSGNARPDARGHRSDPVRNLISLKPFISQALRYRLARRNARAVAHGANVLFPGADKTNGWPLNLAEGNTSKAIETPKSLSALYSASRS